MSKSIHNRVFLEPYKGSKKIESTVKSGFATVKQRSNLIGLKVLVDAEVIVAGSLQKLSAGSVLYFEETTLATEAWARHTYKAEGLHGEEFIMAEYGKAIAVDTGLEE